MNGTIKKTNPDTFFVHTYKEELLGESPTYNNKPVYVHQIQILRVSNNNTSYAAEINYYNE